MDIASVSSCVIGDDSSADGAVAAESEQAASLAQRLTKGALPLDQALQVAVQIADALDKAYRAGDRAALSSCRWVRLVCRKVLSDAGKTEIPANKIGCNGQSM